MRQKRKAPLKAPGGTNQDDTAKRPRCAAAIEATSTRPTASPARRRRRRFTRLVYDRFAIPDTLGAAMKKKLLVILRLSHDELIDDARHAVDAAGDLSCTGRRRV